MTSADLSNLLRQFPDLDATACTQIAAQLKKTSYCQALYILQARAKKNSGDPQTQHFVQQAAIFTSDRAHLKHLLEQTAKLTVVPESITSVIQEEQQVTIQATDEVAKVDTSSSTPTEVAESTPSNETETIFIPQQFTDIADELMSDLQILKEKTEAFQLLTADRPRLIKRTTLVEQASGTSESRSTDTPPPAPRAPKGLDETDLLISEIKSTRKKIKADSGKLAEQLDIIDQFIKSNQVTIRPPEKGIKKQDLTETAGTYSENVISETLVDILIRQGKKDKAVDVLRKLIWKFPQKKHLFAARIQELSN